MLLLRSISVKFEVQNHMMLNVSPGISISGTSLEIVSLLKSCVHVHSSICDQVMVTVKCSFVTQSFVLRTLATVTCVHCE